MRKLYWWAWHKWWQIIRVLERNRRYVDGWRASIVRRFGEPGIAYYPATGDEEPARMWWLWMVRED